MKIGIEGQRLFRNKKHGMDMVALELIRKLQETDHVNQYVIFVKPGEDEGVLKETSNFRIEKVEGGSYPLWEQISLPAAVKKAGCDLLHCTSNTAPLYSPVPLVVTLHDIIYMESGYRRILGGSGSNYQKFGNIYRRYVVPKIIRKSRKIITVSRFEKKRIGDFFGISGDSRLAAVYNGVSEHFVPVTDTKELQRVKNKYHLPDRFFFFLGNTDPKKNTKGTLRAFSDFQKQAGSDIHLVMLDFDRSELRKILESIGDPELEKKICLTGYVTNTDLPAIYSQSDVFLYPSLRESFGIPMLEAMACGVPVITSDTSSMPEVAGDAACLIDPFRPEEITAAMVRLTTDSEYREKLIESGFARAGKFSWRAMAEDVLAIYRGIGASLNNQENR
ncbi:MAG: glycosyltransferase family 1 protein [Bacteroidetes bacterium]|nr:glycosyltransferase family 1 protein [Bacteroidota bacterium]